MLGFRFEIFESATDDEQRAKCRQVWPAINPGVVIAASFPFGPRRRWKVAGWFGGIELVRVAVAGRAADLHPQVFARMSRTAERIDAFDPRTGKERKKM